MSCLRNLALALVGSALIVALSACSMAAEDAATAKEEAAIRAAGKAYLDALQHHDAKKLAALWTTDGIFVDANGRSSNARKLIAKHMKQDAGSPSKVEVDFESNIRFVTPDIAIEEGTTGKTASEKAPTGHFTAIWVKQEGTWRLDKLREREASAVWCHNCIDSLRWMIGDWVGQFEHGKVTCSATWSENKKFILRRFTIEHEGEVVMQGTQRIGWDPVARRIRSWTFDSDGGIVEGAWQQEGDSWIVKTRGSLPDGQQSSAANFWLPEGPDRAVLKSTHVKVGEVEMKDTVIEFQRKKE